MPQLSRPLLLALVAVVGFAGLWFSTLKPSSGDGTIAPPAHAPTPPPAPAVIAARPVPSAAATAFDPIAAALGRHEPVALLLINPSGSVDRSEVAELNAGATRRGVLKLVLPLEAASRLPEIAHGITPADLPTLVLVDRHGGATQLGGFVDRAEISARLDAILAPS